jgi:hypothetical protein
VVEIRVMGKSRKREQQGERETKEKAIDRKR